MSKYIAAFGRKLFKCKNLEEATDLLLEQLVDPTAKQARIYKQVGDKYKKISISDFRREVNRSAAF